MFFFSILHMYVSPWRSMRSVDFQPIIKLLLASAKINDRCIFWRPTTDIEAISTKRLVDTTEPLYLLKQSGLMHAGHWAAAAVPCLVSSPTSRWSWAWRIHSDRGWARRSDVMLHLHSIHGLLRPQALVRNPERWHCWCVYLPSM